MGQQVPDAPGTADGTATSAAARLDGAAAGDGPDGAPDSPPPPRHRLRRRSGRTACRPAPTGPAARPRRDAAGLTPRRDNVCGVIVLLPPSETKHPGGDGPPIALDALSHPELTPLRAALVDELVELAADRSACTRALGLSACQRCRDRPQRRAAQRADAAGDPPLHRRALRRARRRPRSRVPPRPVRRARLAVGSALFGLLARRRSRFPPTGSLRRRSCRGRPALATRWRPLLEPVLAGSAADELVVDLRSGSYAALGRLPDAVHVDVVSERSDGKRTVVSHFNKAHKGRLARILASTRSEPGDAGRGRHDRAARRHAGGTQRQQLTVVVSA